MESFWEALQSAGGAGGAMWIILGFSVVAIGVGLERLVAQWRFTERARALTRGVARDFARGQKERARRRCAGARSAMGDVYLVGIDRLGRSAPEHVDAAVHRERTRVMADQRRGLWIVGSIGATSPFVGLFGTVIGIIRALADIAEMEGAGFAAVAGGIYEALWATALGIGVAVEAVIIFNYFNQRIGRMGVEARMLTDEFLERLHEVEAAGAGEPGAAGAGEPDAAAGAGEPDATASAAAGEGDDDGDRPDS